MPKNNKFDGVNNDLGWKDYLALFVSIIQTIALPLVILIVVLLIILALIAVFK